MTVSRYNRLGATSEELRARLERIARTPPVVDPPDEPKAAEPVSAVAVQLQLRVANLAAAPILDRLQRQMDRVMARYWKLRDAGHPEHDPSVQDVVREFRELDRSYRLVVDRVGEPLEAPIPPTEVV